MNKREKFHRARQILSNKKIKFYVANKVNYHIKCGTWNFYAGTGKITIDGGRYNGVNGLENFVKHMLGGKAKRAKSKKWGTRMPNGRIRLLVTKFK